MNDNNTCVVVQCNTQSGTVVLNSSEKKKKKQATLMTVGFSCQFDTLTVAFLVHNYSSGLKIFNVVLAKSPCATNSVKI